MRKRLIQTIVAVAVATLMFGMTALAAPQKMADGGTFDPQFYAQTYPDVVAALGADANVLYQHYKTYGKKEGRLPYAATATSSATPTVTSVKQYDTGWVVYGATPLISNALSACIANTVVTLQNRSDGTVVMTESTDPNFLDIYTPTTPLKDINGKNLDGSFYINSVASMGPNTRVMCVSDGFIFIYQYGSGTGTLVAAEMFFEKK